MCACTLKFLFISFFCVCICLCIYKCAFADVCINQTCACVPTHAWVGVLDACVCVGMCVWECLCNARRRECSDGSVSLYVCVTLGTF